MTEFLADFDVPEAQQGDVARGLTCNNCGSELDLDFDVGTESAADVAAEREWGAWHAKYAKKLKPELQAFSEHLARVPYLGLLHKMGRRIQRELTRLKSIELSRVDLWRARIPDGSRAFKPSDMGPPPSTSQEGRFSHFGQTAFYLADRAETAAFEVAPAGGVVWVQAWAFNKLGPILDLGNSTSFPDVPRSILEFAFEHDDVLRRKAADSPWKPEYFVPRFVADVARIQGIIGIRYRSVQSTGYNIVLFDSASREHAKPVGEPRLLQFSPPKEPF